MNKIGYVFDLDGTLVDTQTPFHAAAECNVLFNNGISIRPEEISERFAGIPTRQVFKELAPHLDPEVMVAEKWREMDDLLRLNELRILDSGIADILEMLQERKVPMAIASASPRSWI